MHWKRRRFEKQLKIQEIQQIQGSPKESFLYNATGIPFEHYQEIQQLHSYRVWRWRKTFAGVQIHVRVCISKLLSFINIISQPNHNVVGIPDNPTIFLLIDTTYLLTWRPDLVLKK